MEQFFTTIRNAQTPDEVAAIKRWAIDMMKVIEGRRIEEEEEKWQKQLAALR